MLKRFMFLAIALIAMIAFASPASAQTDYYGCLDYVYMNKAKDPVHQNDPVAKGYDPLHTTLTVNSNGTYDLELSDFKIGNMPGALYVYARGVKMDGSVNEIKNAIVLDYAGGIKFTAQITVTDFNASTGLLKYKVKSVNAKFLGISFDTEVHFTTTCTTK